MIGLHFPPGAILPSLRQDDWVIGMIREPIRRLLSAIMHSRRETEDLETFTASTRAMRQMDLSQYLSTDLGRLEARLQLVMFGNDYSKPVSPLSDPQMLLSARAFAQRENTILAPSERSLEFIKFVAHRWHFDRLRCSGSMPTSGGLRRFSGGVRGRNRADHVAQYIRTGFL